MRKARGAQPTRVSFVNYQVVNCQGDSLGFEQMFEKPTPPHIYLIGGEPAEFIFRGKRFRRHAVLSSWRESGGWWNRASDGLYRPDDGSRILWRVEAAPLGTMATFEIEREEVIDPRNPIWRIRPTSRSASA